MKQDIQHTITLPVDLYDYLKREAKRRRMSISAYVRRVLSSLREEEYVEIADEETEKALAEAREDIRAGRYVEVKPGDKKALHAALWGK
ncbi:MAG TPA: ribbon-helix-helix protein, CopG family [Patescibacteria group bacterium]|nr:ribbon-helix-helix protein, CopG family [Patescibacteria group bacterium]